MSIDSMRVGGGRCPPLLVGGLVIACIMMICNWWTLSSTNLELLRQIDELNEQIKISVEERDQCVTQKGILEIKFKSCEDDARITHVKLSQASETLLTCNQELKSYKHLDVTRNADLEALRIDKETITKQLDNQQKENKKLKEELKKMKDDMENLKLSMNAPVKKQTSMMPIASGTNINKLPQLGPVEKSAVQINNRGQEGLHFHGVPILPQDVPGAVRQTPRFSVTKLQH